MVRLTAITIERTIHWLISRLTCFLLNQVHFTAVSITSKGLWSRLIRYISSLRTTLA